MDKFLGTSRASVISLFYSGSPFAVFRRVSAAVVNSLKCKRGVGFVPHIFVEVCELSPTPTVGYPPAAVVMVRRVLRVATALYHTPPSRVLHALCLGVSRYLSNARVAVSSPALIVHLTPTKTVQGFGTSLNGTILHVVSFGLKRFRRLFSLPLTHIIAKSGIIPTDRVISLALAAFKAIEVSKQTKLEWISF